MAGMAGGKVSVTLGIGSGLYQKTLVQSLLREGMLRRVMRAGTYLEIEEPGAGNELRTVKRFPVNKRMNQVVWGVWTRLPKTFRPRSPAKFTAQLADRFRARWIPPCDIFHGWVGFSLACLRAAKRQGALGLLEDPGAHVRYWHEATIEERRRFGVDEREGGAVFSESMMRRVEREYQTCDRIVVLSSGARRTFEQRGYAGKVEVVLPGVDHTFFTPPAESNVSPVFRVCYAGRVELAKGLGYLLQAWKRLALPQAELVLMGEVKPDTRAMLEGLKSVRLTGFLTPQELAERYRESDIFIFPSVSEGFGLVLLEAMACGLPVIAVEGTGADHCVSDGKEGFVVPVRDAERLAESILWCYQHREETRAMGRAARARIEREFTLEHYNQRQIALYRSLVG
jgi:glycosyltransferase involved in cell wall biosynthesis